MRIKELNALVLTSIRHVATNEGHQKAAILFGLDPNILAKIVAVDDVRLRKFIEQVDVPIFRLSHGTSHTFWADLGANETSGCDWSVVSEMRNMLSLGEPLNARVS